jgi:mersacidin/lichenicidin family type 2 lantibiotic
MKKLHVSRAFRDLDYYLSLSDAERAALPAHPAAAIDVTGDQLKGVNGALTLGACSTRTSICSPCPPAVCP